ncbi:DNA-deoxyinosine glycosylase [Mycobacterium sp. CBMA293]|uniref:DNA-deoxyinosine glycosylase n=1 Tax=unclassified Mycolicibacterium TaxID=2636767 RepID=UPI0012DBE1BC|nr:MULTISPECIES: DNA-deoxyinosine glycosylase [unclassified Mycolicibacterium]MUL46011.1 DNA-deoxyinosine glycosylase [Mycolicibacterium sp. CBMA 360]MUL60683.1 DNA-deoxyinosine glycosylase [Mycolicibacterium sp. CBMA 335]MUL72498.1 DNA-deoxyinosine glycosylase [Mycolicibacterium sp. CBMA 311]MUL95101.1 DNA-deoxyinosine glycosylase [Mycolicibacterium sp. CBMA 230]MUM07081.1 DNA-deoxyinosine glycosylase [Mycolicibacterium sp. CBMA 213]
MTEQEMPLRTGLPVVVGANPRVLILGSFPSEKSLDTGEYYANTRNQFWRLLGSLLGFDADLPYPDRIDAVTAAGVALWDVVHSCRRVGSMDANIDRKTLVLNDFHAFLARHPTIQRGFVNGLTAYTLFQQADITLPAARLPSSSGALTMSFADKLAAWQAIN